MRWLRSVLVVGLVATVGCSSDAPGPATIGATTTFTAATTTFTTTTVTTVPVTTTSVTTTTPATTVPSSAPATEVLADRPYEVHVPPSYDGSAPVPLVVLLHGYSASGAIQESYFQLAPLADERGFLYVHPDGTVDARGNRFWNATRACCSQLGAPVDDAAYLSALIAQVMADYRVDDRRVFVVGHSNGGFMSYRLACDHADQVAAIASFAGAMPMADEGCSPSEPVSVLQVHGTADLVIAYEGGDRERFRYPSAEQSVAAWAETDGCTSALSATSTSLDMVADVDGAETTVSAADGCAPGTAVELWTIDGGGHVPTLSAEFGRRIIDFLLAHPKPR